MIKHPMPPRAHPPRGTFVSINYVYALVVYVVENVSGVPFDQYVEENILHTIRNAPKQISGGATCT